MKKRFITALLMAVCCMTAAWAGEEEGNGATGEAHKAKYSFFSVDAVTTDEAYQEATADDVADKLTAYFEQKLKACTFTREEVVPGESMMRTVSHKADIYNAVRNIHRNLEKAVAHDPQQQAAAAGTLQMVARVAIAAFYDEGSAPFEKELRSARKDYRRQIEVFRSVALDE